VEGARRTHAAILTDAWRPSERYGPQEDVVRQMTRPPRSVEGLSEVDAGGGVEALRRTLADHLAEVGISPDKGHRMLVAVSELISNAERHGGGVRRARAGRVGEEDFVCEITDEGPGFDDPLAGYLPGRSQDAGLWTVRRHAERLELFRTPAGFTARVWV
jgi:anti-sigma regulatory factor (Ser/Thr protein kinase)